MNLNIFFIQLVAFWSAITLLRWRHTPKGWRVIAAILVGVLSIAYGWVPAAAGIISGSLWIALVGLPMMGIVHVNRLMTQERYGRAHRVAQVVRWLHPADGFVEFPSVLRGLELAQDGKMDAAIARLSRHQSNQSGTGRMATALLYRSTAQWDQCRDWISHQLPGKMALSDPSLIGYYLRSLGETGDLNGLIQGLDQFQRRSKSRDPRILNLCRLYAFAFCGQPAQVKRLLEGVLSLYPQPTREFWMATATQAAGADAIAQGQFLALRQRCDRSLQQAIDWRLAQPPVDPQAILSPASAQILAQIEADLAHEHRYDIRTVLARRNAPITLILIAINAIVFAIELWAGGSEDSIVLYHLGGLVPEVVVAGEWWRLVSATFLHAGWLHLMLNMLGFYYLGTFVETVLGSRKFLIAYFFCGIGSMALLTLIATFTGATDQLIVGASGAILGLIGGVGAISLQGWRYDKAKVAGKQFRWVLLCLGLQSAFDLVTPQVSLLGHLSGAALGFLIGLMLFNPRHQPRFAKPRWIKSAQK
ncbi:rhomboid family intramembrane serine protease [Myxacorys almedinensis]|uniref:Rhomboid family intramembrane serine protease n=1 Tax=Myxacorys almedinensis A TaxID=2690445 RepID=A0A8J7Z6X9_9CYAN|nr:rhomboid family intramembrane serine protease [Myxacorys almedinensis]NDJ16620.1 rhomboid family intramembrane serine protease [Myxacorys almedinensis A]